MKLDNTDPTYGTVAAGHAPDVLYHGTRADLSVGDLLRPGFASNWEDRRPLSWIYMSGLLEPAVWGAELAVGEGRPRVFIVEPTGLIEDDPNLTNKKFSGNITLSYRSREPLRIVGEVMDWQGHSPEEVRAAREKIDAAWTGGPSRIID
ncbi:MAG: NAD(+)--rifampin ADP-ribosyltransferase [Brevundimonas sp.]|uniref:NAD(+)--rifampin ADP-ribosyltransferase n=1 Tax=Brevundimonas sp. TaxID=1871086 RepID=UPI0025B80ABB|nr:NAD(+)--rifampin ADP-ribosyltransferase [Brevundimonas sp.]MBX3477168.1 NAD(+)--rifampin ADP-ribosyltransferase [Brevundimonas sp.]